MVTRRPTAFLAAVVLLSGTTFVLRSSAQAPAGPKPAGSAKAPAIDSSLLEPIPTPSAKAPPPVSTAGTAAAPPAAPAPSASAGTVPTIVHAPIGVASAHDALDVVAEIYNPHLAKRIVLVYRHDGVVEEIAFLRASEGWVARIPGEHVNPPSLEYAIEVETVAGPTVPLFATRAAMHPVQVPDDIDDVREHHLLGRLDNRRSIVLGSFDYVYYGKSETDGEVGPTGVSTASSVRDQYLRAETAYLYRPLGHVLEFGIRIGIVRGKSPVGGASGSNVGLNYGAPTATFRLHDLVHLETTLFTSVTEQGFSGGIGGALHIGDPYGSKLVFAGETIKTFGSRGWARLDIVRGRVRVSPVVEVGDIPNARPGVRLFTELGFMLPDGFLLALRGGYQARDFNSGGPSGGITLGYSF
ncbi:MAG: hypothetical protein HYV09_05630 [Deltaproteobacteria bacterium]|nr:hypothetical protein [Deltaproteobacteria bacterium]